MSPITITLCLLLFVIILFVTEKLPLAVTSMIALMVRKVSTDKTNPTVYALLRRNYNV